VKGREVGKMKGNGKKLQRKGLLARSVKEKKGQQMSGTKIDYVCERKIESPVRDAEERKEGNRINDIMYSINDERERKHCIK